MEALHIRLVGHPLPLLAHDPFDLLLSLQDHLLDPSRVDASILEQFVQRDARNLAPYRIVA